MARNSIIYKVILAFIIILAVTVMIYITRIPDKEEIVTEQIDEIEWENIDEIRFFGEKDVKIVKNIDKYQLLKEDTAIDIDEDRIEHLFSTFNQLQYATLSSIEFNKWSKERKDSTAIILQLFENTEEVLNLYIHPKDQTTHFRYMGSNEVFQSNHIDKEEFRWIDSLMTSSYREEE